MATTLWSDHRSVHYASMVSEPPDASGYPFPASIHWLVLMSRLNLRWSMWWHRLIYRSFNSHAEFLLRPLGLRKGTTLYRTLAAFLVFGMSAVMHAMVTWKYGNQCAWGRSMIYWILHPVAFILEGVVQASWYGLKRRFRIRISGLVDVFERLVGYVWVCAFLVWVAPKHNWPLRSCEV